MHFGQMITAAREKSRLSLQELAEIIGAPQTVLSSIESAGFIPRDHLITRLIQVLKLNEQAVKARIIRQRGSRLKNTSSLRENGSLLSAVPVVGRITKDN